MNSLSLSTLRDTADHFAILAGLFRAQPSEIKAHAIRKADKSLVALEAFFSEGMSSEAQNWLRSIEALAVLQNRYESIKKFNAESDAIQIEVEKIERENTKWLALTEDERARFVHQAKMARHYLDTQMDINEAHILHRYHRLKALQPLVSFADNAEVLCEGIHHFQNRERYEENISKLQNKVTLASERLKSVRRGFYLALGLCFLLVTIPLCLPFAFSLWARRREIEKQLANTRESIRREERRLVAADEGVVVFEEIREVLGDIPLEQIRSILNEVKELRSEFMGHSVASSQTANLLSFMESAKTKLEEIFGSMPTEPPHCFRWLAERVSGAEKNQEWLAKMRAQQNELSARKRALLRGHSQQILEASIAQLTETKLTNLNVALDDELKYDFANLAISTPYDLRTSRELLWQLSRAQPIDESIWKSIQTKLESTSNVFNACIVHMEVLEMWGAISETGDDDEVISHY